MWPNEVIEDIKRCVFGGHPVSYSMFVSKEVTSCPFYVLTIQKAGCCSMRMNKHAFNPPQMLYKQRRSVRSLLVCLHL